MAQLVKPGDIAICKMCGEAIQYAGPHWEHLGELQPRHPAWPEEVEGGWVDRSVGSTFHQYLIIKYDDYPYTLIVSNRMTTLVSGYAVDTLGVIVARDLFGIFGQEIPVFKDEFLQQAHALAIRWLDIAHCKSGELREDGSERD